MIKAKICIDAKKNIFEEREYSEDDIKVLMDRELPEEDEPGKYLYIIGSANGMYVPGYFQKCASFGNVPVKVQSEEV